MVPAKHVYSYTLDSQDKIARVNENWLKFAEQNNTYYLNKETFLGKSLWNYVSGPEVCTMYQMLMKKVREEYLPVRFNYRCDSPSKLRLLEMHILPLQEHSLEFKSILVKETDRTHYSLLDPLSNKTNDFITMCSWCKSIKTDTGWQPMEEAIKMMGLFESTTVPLITHGMCLSCKVVLDQQLNSIEHASDSSKQLPKFSH